MIDPPLPTPKSLSSHRDPIFLPLSAPKVPQTGQRLFAPHSPPPSLTTAVAPPHSPVPSRWADAPPVPSPGLLAPDHGTSTPGGFETSRAILLSLPHRHTLFPLCRPRRNFRSSPGNPAIALPEVAWPAVRNPEVGVGVSSDRSCHVGYGGATPHNQATESPAESRQCLRGSHLLPPPVHLLEETCPEGEAFLTLAELPTFPSIYGLGFPPLALTSCSRVMDKVIHSAEKTL